MQRLWVIGSKNNKKNKIWQLNFLFLSHIIAQIKHNFVFFCFDLSGKKIILRPMYFDRYNFF